MPWAALTKAWWTRLWASPMAGQFIESDVDGLYVLATLKDAFWSCAPGDPKMGALAAEIRMQEQRFGVTPLDRRRLEWELEREPAGAETAPPTPAPAPVDPRKTMRLVG